MTGTQRSAKKELLGITGAKLFASRMPFLSLSQQCRTLEENRIGVTKKWE